MKIPQQSVIAISFDSDWVPDEVLQYCVDLLAPYNVPATFFMTSQTSVPLIGYEVGIHPYFPSFDLTKHIAERMNEYPKAKGSRSHSLFFTERLRESYKKFPLKYQSNTMLYKQASIKPHLISKRILDIPLFWMDYFALEVEGQKGIDINNFDLESPGIKVFDFHPVHIYINTCSLGHYEKAKQYNKQPDQLKKLRNKTKPGVKDFLKQLLKKVSEKHLQMMTLGEIYEKYKRKKY